VRATDARYRKAHPDRKRAILARWLKAHPDWKRAYTARYRQDHPDMMRKMRARMVAKVCPWYAKQMIRGRLGRLISVRDIPESLVKVKTRLIKLKRLCKTQRRPTPETNMTKSSG
jgi:hypothetical protein